MNPKDFDNPRHAEFVAAYFKNNMIGVHAYRAVYGKDMDYMVAAVNASNLLKNPKVSAAIQKMVKERVMGADELLARVSEFASSEHGRYIGEDGTVDIVGMVRDGKAHLIKSIKETKYGTVYEFHDPKAYQELQGKYLALWKEKIEIESAYEREILELLKNGDITKEQAVKVLGEDEAKRIIE